MTDEERIKNDIDVYADNFMSNLFNAYQSFARGTIEWKDLLDLGLTAVKEKVEYEKNWDGEIF